MQFELDRRQLLAAIGASTALSSGFNVVAAKPIAAPGIAITVDDFDLADTPLLTGEARDTAIRAALKRHRVKAAGFVAGKYIDDTVAPRVLQHWSDDGHLVGNHSFSHHYFGGDDPGGFMADILKCEPLLSGYSGFQKLFRFPYLAEGKTAAGRDAMRALLVANGYRNGHVTIDTSDWYIDNRLKARLKTDPTTDLAGYRRFYLSHLWERAMYYDGLAQSIFGHSINHTILLHHRLTTALFLDDTLKMFRQRGWRIVDAADAFASHVFAKAPNALPAGQSLLWALAKSDIRLAEQLRYPGEDGDYEAAEMDALKL
jgi:peptidoglycan/xylan/chitin deacetylase (PgdA/CDA1 family)